MQDIYLPEGRHQCFVLTADKMENALLSGEILQGRAVRATEDHDLIVEGDGILGIIPHDEAAIGIKEGKTREIAVLSRVGKQVCFKVTGKKDGAYILSRRQSQLEALSHYMNSMQEGEIIRCRVTHIESFGAFVDIGCGVCSMIGIENISVSRIRHPSERFSPGQDIYAVISGKDRENGRIMLSHKELLGTWEQNAALIKAGETVGGIVRGHEDYGIFVELTPNLSGLAEYREGIGDNACVSVFVKSIVPEKMKIKLCIIDSIDCRSHGFLQKRDYFLTEGIIKKWRYSPENCEKSVETVF